MRPMFATVGGSCFVRLPDRLCRKQETLKETGSIKVSLKKFAAIDLLCDRSSIYELLTYNLRHSTFILLYQGN